mmetsp:Transcript_25937/g.32266  ORF Transcript_25937/g.32266 Transcript_25937/m.32266 type:complete len:229 (-) Transcript_25937:120-806(-)
MHAVLKDAHGVENRGQENQVVVGVIRAQVLDAAHAIQQLHDVGHAAEHHCVESHLEVGLPVARFRTVHRQTHHSADVDEEIEVADAMLDEIGKRGLKEAKEGEDKHERGSAPETGVHDSDRPPDVVVEIAALPSWFFFLLFRCGLLLSRVNLAVGLNRGQHAIDDLHKLHLRAGKHVPIVFHTFNLLATRVVFRVLLVVFTTVVSRERVVGGREHRVEKANCPENVVV